MKEEKETKPKKGRRKGRSKVQKLIKINGIDFI